MIVGVFVSVVLARVVPDLVRIVYPLNVFGYVTDGNGVVVSVTPYKAPKAKTSARAAPSAAGGTAGKRRGGAAGKAAPAAVHIDAVLPGDRVRLDRVKPFDRKPGIAGAAFTYDNPDRRLPVERAGRERVLHLAAHAESLASRTLAVLRILLYVISVALGAILYLIKPSIATAGFFIFCLGAEAPTTYADLIVPNPWRPIPIWIGDTIRGAARTALLLFALCLIDGDRDEARERLFAWLTTALGIAIGTVLAYADWLLTFAARPAGPLDRFYSNTSSAITALTTVVFALAFLRARGIERRRIVWIVAAFLFADTARLASDRLYPGHIPLWVYSVLVSTSVVPVVTMWIAVIRQRFFGVDFVVSRAVVYVALTAAVIGTISVTEEFATYLFYNNTDLAYGVIIGISMLVGSMTGRIKNVLDRIVDRFIFRDRHAQREALELIAGYILDAQTAQDVYRALLKDATHALHLSFGGILLRGADGAYELGYAHEWPADCVVRLEPDDELTRRITRSRSALAFSSKDAGLIRHAFPTERLTFAAPLFSHRVVSAIVIYGHNVSGLDLDPDEREHLVRVVAHASIALSAIELSRYQSIDPPEDRTRTPVRTI